MYAITKILAMGYLLNVAPILQDSLSMDEYALFTPLAILVSKGDSIKKAGGILSSAIEAACEPMWSPTFILVLD